MLRNVLILSASAGAGHVRAGQALERAFAESGAVQAVHHIDTLEFTNPLFRRLYSKAYIDMVNAMPEVLGWLYDVSDKPDWDDRLKVALEKLNTVPFVKMLERYQPDLTVCTHFLPAEIIAWLTGKGTLERTRQAIVVTDFDVHAQWICSRYRPLLRRARRDARPPGGAGNPGAADHRLGHPHRPCVRGAEGPGRAPRRSTGSGTMVS